ncbi:MAG: CBS domain-containing protein [Armatimonadota bacterium]|nr:CBS domain-containing protein [Armatimonadota bacterium]
MSGEMDGKSVETSGGASVGPVGPWVAAAPVVLPTTSVAMALRLMRDAGLPALPVMQDGQFAGLVHERDLLRLTPSEASTLDRHELHAVLAGLTVARAVRPGAAVSPECPVEEAARRMTRAGAPVVPVVSGGMPVGVLLWTAVLEVLLTRAARLAGAEESRQAVQTTGGGGGHAAQLVVAG